MSKQEFLDILKTQLQVLEEKEQKDILDEYALHIDMKVENGQSEEQAIQDFGSIDDLAADILEAYHVNPAYCTPSAVQKKAWKTPDMNKVKEESIEVCARAGGFCKRKCKAFGQMCQKGFTNAKTAYRENKEKVKQFFSGKKGERTETPVSEEKKRGMIGKTCRGIGRFVSRTLCGLAAAVSTLAGLTVMACIWCIRTGWNLFCILMAFWSALMAVGALFSLGVLLICVTQGYPLRGVTIGSFGLLLCSTALTGLFVSFRKKEKKSEQQEEVVQEREVQYE